MIGYRESNMKGVGKTNVSPCGKAVSELASGRWKTVGFQGVR
jgi:hypothetical protein